MRSPRADQRLPPSSPAASIERVTILVRAEFAVSPEHIERFGHLARTLADTAADETGTLRYDWYGSADPATFVVLEEYAGPEEALGHNEHCAPLLAELFEIATLTTIALHGELDADVMAWVDDHPQARAYPPLPR